MTTQQDKDFMQAAQAMARRGLGRAWPNPSVGCVIVKNGIIIGRGRTAESGRPHAEAVALAEAGLQARGATAYVTLEPCALHGRDVPCAGELVKAGIVRVVIACIDPNPKVLGHGIEILKKAGLEVTTGILEQEALELNRGFILRVTEKRPMVTLKTATSKDGKIAPARGERQWITGTLARRRVHLERSLHDAVLAGIGTVLVDDPLLTARLPHYEHKTVRVILDSHLRIATDSQLVKSAKGYPLWVFHSGGHAEKVAVLEKAGVRIFSADTNDIAAILNILASEGITRLLVEGGAKVHTSFLEAGFCDRFLWFRGPKPLGAGALDALEGHNIANIESEFSLKRLSSSLVGEDLLEIYTRKA